MLRYFTIAGRAQALRHALLDAGVSFEDVRFSVEQWHAGLIDRRLGGAYGGLPTLSWGDALVCETLAIASFLARELGEYAGLDGVEIARREAVCSNCYLEVSVRLGELIWCDFLYPGADRARSLAMQGPRMLAKLAGVEAQLDGAWLCGSQPGMADHFAAEALWALRTALGPAREPALRARLPGMFEHTKRLHQRPNLEAAHRDRPSMFTGRSDEAAVLAAMAATDPHAFAL